ncbi:MAG TPA: GNAT family N-acetyltransferase, partial [Rhizobium sp.]|nr:GNAT family N-acetyltransferase [Rhizobium sp.]
MTRLETERLISRPWTEDDIGAFFELCSDPEVMHYFGGPHSREKVETTVLRCIELQQRFGVWL